MKEREESSPLLRTKIRVTSLKTAGKVDLTPVLKMFTWPFGWAETRAGGLPHVNDAEGPSEPLLEVFLFVSMAFIGNDFISQPWDAS